MSQANYCTHSGPDHTPWPFFCPLISPWEVLCPMSWMTGRVQPGGYLPVASVNCLLHFFPSQLYRMQEHSVEDEWVVRPTSLPLWIFIEKQVCIQMAFCLSNGQPITLHKPFGGQRLMPFITIRQVQ